MLAHGNYRTGRRPCASRRAILHEGDIAYLYLPLAHSFALLIQLISIDLGGTIAYFGGDPKQIVPELMPGQAELPAVGAAHLREDLHAGHLDQRPREDQGGDRSSGSRCAQLQAAGQEVPAELQARFDEADEELYVNVRDVFGGRLRQAITGAAPIAQEILEFFYACGVPVLEGYGMTETATAATFSTLEDHKFGTVGRPLPGVEVRIADDGEMLIKGAHIFGGYYKRRTAFGAIEDGWLHTGDLGELDEDGYLKITGRKKDIIITAGGKNLTPANLENDLKQSRWISQAVMHGDRRPYPVALITLDAEEIAPGRRRTAAEGSGGAGKDERSAR